MAAVVLEQTLPGLPDRFVSGAGLGGISEPSPNARARESSCPLRPRPQTLELFRSGPGSGVISESELNTELLSLDQQEEVLDLGWTRTNKRHY